MKANSKEWWNNEFSSETGWDRKTGINGPAQTRYFMELIIKYCGLNISGSVLDYGCAMGQGVEVLSRYTNDVEGYDFAEVGVEKARQMNPGLKFTHEFPSKQYDFVVCSNVLEHFENPLPEFMKLLGLSKRYVIIMAPYNQTPTCEVHPVTITENTFPVKASGFTLMERKHIPNEKPEMGGSNQIMFIYKKEEA